MTSNLVDWQTAVSVGARLAGDGPTVDATEAQDTVAELRAGADRSTGLVRDFTGLVAADHTAPVLVVDRLGWIQANADAFATIIEPLAAKLTEKKGPPTGLSLTIGSKVTGGEVGLLLGFLAGKVLGQFDPFHAPDGRLLLVAPNIVHVERELEADPADFRLWVCLHEETHRVQFTAVPWMREPPVQPDPGAHRHRRAQRPDRRPRQADLRGRPGHRSSGGSLMDVLGIAGAEGDPRPGHRGHVAAGGPRRRRHGRRRAERHPVGRAHPPALQRPPQGHWASWTGRCAGCSAWTRRWRSTATGRPSSARSSTRPA